VVVQVNITNRDSSKSYIELNYNLDEEDALFRPASRSNYSTVVTKILQKWFEDHLDNPYPTEEERIQICSNTNLTRKQLRVWLINSRKVRFLP
jgi:hypothetical protein